ncbi:MAG: PilZ domain-containing protein [Proteobacteria bacterium]|nr:PilZ domain-containing protein [Pseudomonadota bacterium]
MNDFSFLTTRSSPATERIFAGIDRSFLGSVKDTFGGLGFKPEGLEMIGWTIAIACLAGGLAILANHYFFRRATPIPSGTIIDPSQVAELLQAACDQRHKIEFSFSRDEQISRPLYCSIETLDEGNLILNAGDYIQAHQGWIARPVVCYFRVSARGGSGTAQFYNFESEVAGINKRPDGSTLLTLPLPDRVRMQQKRIHLRMEPPLEYMLGIAIWPELFSEDGQLERRLKRWGKPALAHHAAETGQMHVANISAGGLRIDVPRQTIKETELDFHIGQRFYILTELYDPDMKRKQRLWFIGRVQNRYEDFSTKDLEVGLKFLEIGNISDPETMEIAWTKVGGQGIDNLGNWIQRRHLELYRSKGII